MHVHIGRSKRDAGALRTSPLFAKVSESGSTCVFVHQAWTVLGAQLLEAAAAIASAERAAFEQLRVDVEALSTSSTSPSVSPSSRRRWAGCGPR
jgi:hypothetical protein